MVPERCPRTPSLTRTRQPPAPAPPPPAPPVSAKRRPPLPPASEPLPKCGGSGVWVQVQPEGTDKSKDTNKIKDKGKDTASIGNSKLRELLCPKKSSSKCATDKHSSNSDDESWGPWGRSGLRRPAEPSQPDDSHQVHDDSRACMTYMTHNCKNRAKYEKAEKGTSNDKDRRWWRTLDAKQTSVWRSIHKKKAQRDLDGQKAKFTREELDAMYDETIAVGITLRVKMMVKQEVTDVG